MWGPIWSAENDVLMFLYSNTNDIHISVKATFNKWGDSVDYIVTRLPQNELEVKAMIQVAKDFIDKGFYNRGYGKALCIDKWIASATKKLEKNVNLVLF